VPFAMVSGCHLEANQRRSWPRTVLESSVQRL
jgi:hypothetical protein